MTSRRAFGDALRRERERRGITLDTISGITKISASLLKALEGGDCSRWPTGIYSRAYIRDYAQAIGLDRDETAARFAECFADTAFPDGTREPERRETAPALPVPPTPLRLTIEESQEDRRVFLARRSLAVLIDLLAAIIVATALKMVTGAGFWMVLSIVGLSWHGLGVFRRGSSTSGLVAKALGSRQSRGSDPSATEDPALAQAA